MTEQFITKSPEKNYCVYMHINKINNKKYIGQTCQNPPTRRWNLGLGYKNNNYFYNAIQKYGWDNFEHIILKNNLTKEEADRYEILYIKKFHTWINDPKCQGYNLESGGNKNKHLSDETKKKISEAKKGEKNWNYNKHLSDETKKKISESNKGKHLSDETKKKISEAKKNVAMTKETKQKISKSNQGRISPMKGKHLSNKTKEKISNSLKNSNKIKRKQVICLNNNKIFNSITEAAEYYKISRTGLSNHLAGKTKSCGRDPDTNKKLLWKYFT